VTKKQYVFKMLSLPLKTEVFKNSVWFFFQLNRFY